MKDVTLRQLEYFAAVAREDSITRAALRCHVTQAAISQSLRELERSVGVPLLIRRRSRGVHLTAAGREFATRARRLLEEAHHLVDRVDADTETGSFTLGCFPTLSAQLVPEVADFLAHRHPRVELDIVEAPAPQLQEMLLRGRLDLCFVYEMQALGEVERLPVRERRIQVVVAADHPLADRDPIRLTDLAGHPAALLDLEPANYLNEAVLRRAGVTPRVAYRSRDVATIRALVGRGLAWGLLMQEVPASQEGRPLRFLPIADGIGTNSLLAVHPPGVPPGRLASAVLEHCRAALAGPEHRAL